MQQSELVLIVHKCENAPALHGSGASIGKHHYNGKGNHMKKQRKSFRMRFVFWLDLCQEGEADLAEYIDELKEQRKFVTTIKQGLRLIRDLRAGDIDVLLELFPEIKSKLQPDSTELVSLITAMMHNPAKTITPPRPLPAYDAVPKVGSIDESKARELSVSNALAALDDF
jgi:hypothetical protein